MNTLSIDAAAGIPARKHRARAGRPPQTAEPETALGVLDQVAVSVRPNNRLATAVGSILGGFIPVASFVIAHFETQLQPVMWLLVAAGLMYSALTVFQWAKIAFKNPIKALGFVALLEGVMTFAHTGWLGFSALFILVMINGIATGYNLIADRRTQRTARERRAK